MKNIIRLDYSQICSGQWIKNPSVFEERIDKAIRSQSCPNCEAPVKVVLSATYTMGTGFLCDAVVYECSCCGWWFKFTDNHEFSGVDRYYEAASLTTILTEAPEDLSRVPFGELISDLNRRKSLIRRITTPASLETLLRDVMRGVYDCEVRHVGRSGDGGIDLLLLETDQAVAVQVKHRSNPDRVESLDIVRSFLGAMIVRGYRKGMFISLANRFPPGAKPEAELGREKGVIESMEFVDCGGIVEMLGIVRGDKRRPPWVNTLTEMERQNIVQMPEGRFLGDVRVLTNEDIDHMMSHTLR